MLIFGAFSRYVLKEEQEKAECLASGKDWEIERLRNVGVDEADAAEKRRKGKTNPDTGFASFEQATFRKYNGLAKQIKPDMQQVLVAYSIYIYCIF